ncbi:MAG: hypothetical protein OEY10_04785 [Nitrosopumilus sp.]|nr:hypothetical protein [Nitrosopumilus sp.]
MDILDQAPTVAPTVAAGLLLTARALGADLGLTMPRVDAIVEATGAGRSRAYEVRDAIVAQLPSLVRPAGRPPAVVVSGAPELQHALRGEMLRFVMDHPGCVYGGPQRRRYAGSLRRFVLELRERYGALSLASFAEATSIALGTLEDWLRPGQSELLGEPSTPRASDSTVAKVEMLLQAWHDWEGRALAPFGQHVRHHLLLDFSDALIAKLLFEHGARSPKRRPGRAPDEEALRGAFETFFAGAQWVGDGKALQVVLDGEVYRFNLELMVDAHSGAFVGIEISEVEDSAAVVEALRSGERTTGAMPIAVLLDNKPCNHTPEVEAALGTTLRIRATTGRPQNKAHVEGGFGLFAQKAPPIELCSSEPHTLAQQVTTLVATAFAQGLNLRPRPDRGGLSRAQLYPQPVSDEQRQQAETQLRERLRKQERARQTRAARLDLLVRDRLDRAFERLRLDDPERHFRDAIARYPLDAIVEAIAIFTGKQNAATLPDRADARYLLGIVRNVAHVHEADAILEALLDERLEARDALLAPLSRQRQRLATEHPCTDEHLRALVQHAMAAERALERLLWIDTLAQLIAPLDRPHQQTLFRAAARRMHSFFKVPRHERDAATRRLARLLWPLR